ncbi:MAG: flagellar hook-length control protein FliK [Nitrosomonas sp.]|nr:flagellar hook-length control protein FliK [Nitrosomonas sp.]MBP7112461.1 flagellar hook-length control protein FliK [Nitrosomonas sp.]
MNPITLKTDLITPLTQIKSVTPVTPVTAILDSQNPSAVFESGQKYQASIETRLINGNSRVLVADKLLQMHLPESFQPGSKLELMLISQEPDLKFLILNNFPSDINENNAVISSTGRFLDRLMQQDTVKQASISISSSAAHTPLLTSSAPILTSASINSTELPSLLQKAISQSGLFYESHQAQWISGRNTLENLQQEPQGKLMLVVADQSNKISASLSSDMPIHTQSIPLVQQQLNTLETGYLLWRSEVWQGQPMDWEIHEQHQDNAIESGDAANWRTKIHLTLPQLGEITATIILNAHDINIKLDASQVETVNLLRNNQSPLGMDMQSAGLNIQSLEVQHNDEI